VVVNYSSLVLALVIVVAGPRIGWSLWLDGAVAALLLVALVSFAVIHLRTGLWRLVHTRVEELDERQVQVTHEALRYSYSIFSILTLLLLLAGVLLETSIGSMGAVLLAALIYVAHTLPAAVLAWTEKEI